MATKQWQEENSEKMKQYRNEWYEKNKILENSDKLINQAKKIRDLRNNIEVRFPNLDNEFKKDLKCSECGFNHPAALDFHHVNPNEKEYSIAYLKHLGSKEKLLQEVDKCIVLCANCHRIHHHGGDD